VCSHSEKDMKVQRNGCDGKLMTTKI